MSYQNDRMPTDIGIEEKTPLLMRYLEPGFSQGLAEMRTAIDRGLTELIRKEIPEVPNAMGPADRAIAARADTGERIRRVLVRRANRSR